MIPLEIAKGLRVVPESVIREAAESVGGDNRWKELLDRAAVFRVADLHPIFLTNKDTSAWTVSSEETFMRPLH
jgi:hypothetical protein